MNKNQSAKPEKYYKDYIATRIEPTEQKPYILDYVMFCVVNDEQIMAFYNNLDSLTELLSNAKVDRNNFSHSPEIKEAYGYDIKNIKQLNNYEIISLLKSIKLKSLISSRYALRLKECTNGGYIESSWAPSPNMRASKNQIASIAKDLQRGYNKKLSKQNKADKNHENEIEPEM